jgi:hypothetical protein
MPGWVTARSRFLHVPKTGGTWVWRAIEAGGLEFEVLGVPPTPNPKTNHLDLSGTDEYADRFTIAFVRHPLEWWRSLWAYRMGDGWDPRRQIDSVACSDDFNTFIEQVIEHLPLYLEADYARYIGPPSEPISFIGRYEFLADDLVRALKTAGEEFDEAALRAYPPDNVSDYERFPAFYRPEVAARLADSERATIERFYADDPIPAALIAEPARSTRRGKGLAFWRSSR